MIGPGGTRDEGLGGPKVTSVSSDGYSVKVEIDADRELFRRNFLFVEVPSNMTRDWRVRIHGGNTNDGDIATYEAAVEAYSSALKVAKNLWYALREADDMFSGYEDDDLRRAMTHHYPDYMLIAFLLVQGEEGFAYMRGHDPDESRGNRVYGLAQLRERCVEVARGLAEVSMKR